MNELFYIAVGAEIGYLCAKYRGEPLDLEVQS